MREFFVVVRRCAIAGVVVGVVLAGCSSSSETSASNDTVPRAAKLPTVTIDAADFTFAMPKKIPAGYVNVTMANRGKEQHQVNFVKLGSATFDELEAAVAETNMTAIEFAAGFVGGPNVALPGGKSTAMVKLDAGKYAVICFIPGVDDGKPHAVHGMVKPVEVVRTADSVYTPPVADSTIQLSEFTFVVPKDFDGKEVIDITNVGNQAHELVLLKLVAGKTLADAKAYLLTPPGTPPPAGPPPFTVIHDLGGVTGLSTGQHNWLNMNLTPGNYALFCLFPDTSDKAGLPHALKGMVKKFTIT